MNKPELKQLQVGRAGRVRDSSGGETVRMVDGCVFTDVVCNGKCRTCPQREWCLLTPVSRSVK